MLEIRWLGAAGIEIKHEHHVLLIDPYFTRISKRQILFGRPAPDKNSVKQYLADLPGTLAGIIISHTHFDHAMDAPAFAACTNSPLIGSQSLDRLLEINGFRGRVTVCENRRAHLLDGNIKVQMLPSKHGLVLLGRVPYPGEIKPAAELPLNVRDYRLGSVYAPLIEMGGVTFMHIGSANFIADELQGRHCDILFLCVPGWKAVPEYPERLLEILQPRVIVPFHFDDFSVPLKPGGRLRRLPFLDMNGFLNQIKSRWPRIEIRIPDILQPIRFDSGSLRTDQKAGMNN